MVDHPVATSMGHPPYTKWCCCSGRHIRFLALQDGEVTSLVCQASFSFVFGSPRKGVWGGGGGVYLSGNLSGDCSMPQRLAANLNCGTENQGPEGPAIL